MKSPDNKNFLPGSQEKVKEYAERIHKGEDPDLVMSGLGTSFRSAVDQRLQEDQKLQDQKKIEELRRQLGVAENKNMEEVLLSPEDVLRKVAEYCEPYMSAPLEAVADGTFAGIAKLKIENGSVVLVRHASDREHLTKQGKSASAQQMMDSSLFSGGAQESGAVHTSADIENWIHHYSGKYPVYGEFRIPVGEFLSLAKEGKIIIGNLSEAEIVLSGDVAEKYLTNVIEKDYS